MSISAKSSRRRLSRNLIVYVLATIFCALFGAVYERFSHGVYSYYMLYAFAIPLCLGVLPLSLIIAGAGRVPSKAVRSFFDCGVATLTVGCIFKGVLYIFGTTNRLSIVYMLAGIPLLAIGIILYLAPSTLTEE
ncbi:MAG: hypothetical protein IJS72_04535 [Oscillospiraceae bacterium]|nr:hypothetical protein [Oscillospiraceae bacterium]